MLPFLKPKSVSGLIISHRKPDGGMEEQHSEGNENHAMEAVAEDILRAISSKDAKHLALALQSAYDICESNADEDDSNDYDSQNAKAAEQEQE